jgi:hypothetical protein
MRVVHVVCPHCHGSVTVGVSEPIGTYGVQTITAQPGPTTATLDDYEYALRNARC